MYLRNASNISYIELGNPPNINDFYFTEMVPNPSDWAVNLLEINVLGSLRVQGLTFDSGSNYIYVPSSDLTTVRNWLGVANCKVDPVFKVINCPCTNETLID